MKLQGGFIIVCIAMLLRDMAVVSNKAGLICYHNGLPIPTPELATLLSVDEPWLETILRTILMPRGFVAPADEGWSVTDPVITNHFLRLNKNSMHDESKAPPITDTGSCHRR